MQKWLWYAYLGFSYAYLLMTMIFFFFCHKFDLAEPVGFWSPSIFLESVWHLVVTGSFMMSSSDR